MSKLLVLKSVIDWCSYYFNYIKFIPHFGTMPFHIGANSSTKSNLLESALVFVSRHGKKKMAPPIKLLYHVYLQAILQQECIEGECFHKCLSQGVAHNPCDVKAHS